MSYLEELWETFIEEPIEILCTTLLIWALFPILIFALRGILLLIGIVNLDVFTKSFSNLIIPWWASIVIDFLGFLLEYLIFFVITLILVHHEKIEPINFKGLVERLKRL